MAVLIPVENCLILELFIIRNNEASYYPGPVEPSTAHGAPHAQDQSYMITHNCITHSNIVYQCHNKIINKFNLTDILPEKSVASTEIRTHDLPLVLNI